jgi:hypothetical protein
MYQYLLSELWTMYSGRDLALEQTVKNSLMCIILLSKRIEEGKGVIE